jgi:uncharacterized RDD family membrane protein YckC
MFCSGCGRAVPDGAAFCPQCGRPALAPAEPIPGGSVVVPPVQTASPQVAAVAPGLVYAGFWLRFVAYIIDSVIVSVFAGIIIVILIFATGFGAVLRNLPDNPNPDAIWQATFVVTLIALCIGAFLGVWLYYACMESSRHQGTLGKMALGIIVTDMQLRPVSFGRASGRFFAKIITGLIPLCIGYIMAGFTAQKQALHDMIASCLVMRRI